MLFSHCKRLYFLLCYGNKIRLLYVKYLEQCLAHSKCVINVTYYYKCMIIISRSDREFCFKRGVEMGSSWRGQWGTKEVCFLKTGEKNVRVESWFN